MGRFTPVYDPEKARDEQDENELRKHRQFDTPFAQLSGDLNEKKKPRDDMKPLGQPSGDLYKDQNKLWRKKEELFDKKKMWGRETSSWSNPEEARADGKREPKKAPGEVHWGTKGHFGGRSNDQGDQVVQRNEVDQTMVKNEKGLWVRKKDPNMHRDDEEKPLEDGAWRCPKCKEEMHKKRRFCTKCDYDRNTSAESSAIMRAKPKGEDPRLEAAKQKGRGTADAAQKALQALNARRKQEKAIQDSMGLTSGSRGATNRDRDAGGPITTLNSSSQQVRPQKRLRKYKQWQGVHTTDQEAKDVVVKAIGESAAGGRSSASSSATPAAPAGAGGAASAASSSAAGDGARQRSRSPQRRRSRSCSWSLEASRSGSGSPSPERNGGGDQGTGGDVVVDFF